VLPTAIPEGSAKNLRHIYKIMCNATQPRGVVASHFISSRVTMAVWDYLGSSMTHLDPIN
jgi:hypothetical protein